MATNSGERVFTSWKEIASFFGKGVRTVQRWERKFGLPISRPSAAKNVVLATEGELREWIHRSSPQMSADEATASIEVDNLRKGGNLVDISLRLKRLEDDTARLARVVAAFSERIDELRLKSPLFPSTTGLIVKGSPQKLRAPARK